MSHHQSPSKKRAGDDTENDPKKAKESHSPASRTRSKGTTSASSAGTWTNKTHVPDLAPVSGQNTRYHTITMYLPVQGAAEAVEWYKKVFNARELLRFDSPDHKTVFHCELAIGDSIFMLSEDMGMGGVKNPKAVGGASVNLCIQVPDVDTSFKLAVDNGAKQVRAVENQFYGDRNGQISDPFGHSWTIGTTIKEVTNEEMQAAMAEMASKGNDAQNGNDK